MDGSIGSILAIVLIVNIIANLIMAFLFSTAASNKGYSGGLAFIVVLIFGVTGCIYVAALPDKNQQLQTAIIVELLKAKR